MASNEFAPDSYWQALKERAAGLAAMPGNAVQAIKDRMAQGSPMLDPNNRPSAPQEAMPANIDPLTRQKIIEQLMQRQGGSPAPQQGVDQRQLLLQEAQRRGIPIPPDSPLMQGQGGQITPDNPAGIQF